MINRIEDMLSSMAHRKLLFIIGDHLCGKTALVKGYLQKFYGENADKHYIDVGLYMQEKVPKEKLELYELFPEEFGSDAKVLFQTLVKEAYEGKELLVFDHMEFLLSEKYTGWIKPLDKVTLNDKKAIVVVPSEYESSLPLNAYRYLKYNTQEESSHED